MNYVDFLKLKRDFTLQALLEEVYIMPHFCFSLNEADTQKFKNKKALEVNLSILYNTSL